MPVAGGIWFRRAIPCNPRDCMCLPVRARSLKAVNTKLGTYRQSLGMHRPTGQRSRSHGYRRGRVAAAVAVVLLTAACCGVRLHV